MSDPADLDRLFRLQSERGHCAAIGMIYAGHGDDWVEFHLPWRADLVGISDSGILASGPIISMMDMGCGLAVAARMKRDVRRATLDLRIDYHRAATPGSTLIARSECYRLTRRIAFVRSSAHDGDPARPVASVNGSFMITGGGE